MPRAVVAEFPFYGERIAFPLHAQYMVLSTTHWMPLVNGYSDYIPQDFRDAAFVLDSFPSNDTFEILEKHRVRYVGIHWDMYGPRAEEIRTKLKEFEQYLRPLGSDATMSCTRLSGFRDRALTERRRHTDGPSRLAWDLLVFDLSFDQSVSRAWPFGDLPKLMLRFEPVVAVMPMSGATSLPDLVCAILYFFIKGERQMMSFEVLKPFVPGDWAKTGCTWKIEANAGAAVVDRDRLST